MLSLAAIPPAVQHGLLCYLPDFITLHSAILTARSLYATFQSRRDLVLTSVAQNLLGCCDALKLDFEDISGTVKFLAQTRAVLQALEPVVFQLLVEQDAHWDELGRRPSAAESARLHRAGIRFARFCALSSQRQQSVFLAELATIEVFEMAHFADGLRKMVSVLEDDRLEYALGDDDDERVSRLVSTGPANVWRLWNLHPTRNTGLAAAAEFEEEMDIAMAVTDDPSDELGAFDDAFHHFEVSRNLSAFDSTSMRAILDVGHQKTEEALLQLGSLMSPPEPAPKPSRMFRSFKLPLLLNRGDKSLLRLPFLPDDLNSLSIRSEIPYSILALNGSTRISPLSPRQLAEFWGT